MKDNSGLSKSTDRTELEAVGELVLILAETLVWPTVTWPLWSPVAVARKLKDGGSTSVPSGKPNTVVVVDYSCRNYFEGSVYNIYDPIEANWNKK